ncbi:hypothetical protein [Sandaracinus amylolyticus]|uniref:hypothetical protein n=1 Tax=Sandaracinus amylolyticus TaxID=927083 RepID=UPI0012ECCD4B|nr:hypothetical protein [Sandaracinus amylolyticus]
MRVRRPLRSSEAISLGAVVVAGAFFFVLLSGHAQGLNGPSYWQWPWLPETPFDAREALALYAPPIVCFVVAQQLARKHRALALGALMACATLLMFAAQEVVTPDATWLERGGQIVDSLGAHSYYDEAQVVAQEPEWLARFPELMPRLRCHAPTKPPAILLLYTWLFRASSPSAQTARFVALALALLASCAVPMIYALARTLRQRPAAAFAAASLFSLVPALGAFWPSFDAVYAVMTCAQVITWHRALVTGHARWAIAFGLLVAIAWFVAYNFLILGAFLLLHALVESWRRRDRRVALPYLRALARPALLAAIVVATIVLFYAGLRALTGFDAIATFRTAIGIQDHLATGLDRPWERTIVYDLTDYALGMAWLPVVPAIVGACDAWRDRRRTFVLAMTCFAQPLIVAAIGIMPTETARTWILMMPFVLVPAGIEIARWRRSSRAVLYALTMLLSIAITRAMLFTAP